MTPTETPIDLLSNYCESNHLELDVERRHGSSFKGVKIKPDNLIVRVKRAHKVLSLKTPLIDFSLVQTIRIIGIYFDIKQTK